MRFYEIREKSESFAQVYSTPEMKFMERCTACGRGGERVPPLSIKFDRRNIPDLSFYPPDILVTDRVKAMFEQQGIRGVEFLEVSYQGDPQLLQGKRIWHFNVVAKVKASPECNIMLLKNCEVCGRKEYSTWDGGLIASQEDAKRYDVFRIEEHWGYVFINERVKKLIIENDFVNAKFIEDKEVKDTLAWMRPKVDY
ncbi:hypothetical protein EV586_10825 [Tumebacillus sp. BK434]|uniref:imm11 family protein n=1 Tax=Tumebacillus sp. BK434 TaxID=2512169 RepID=UPI001049DC07|nr:DUF1629 domain-containing protein [Tumebacillus sp. BK434]TCP52651.1 hypothetical protein EV586_10825 [Tumebacillus sp. BK434]